MLHNSDHSAPGDEVSGARRPVGHRGGPYREVATVTPTHPALLPVSGPTAATASAWDAAGPVAKTYLSRVLSTRSAPPLKAPLNIFLKIFIY